MRPVVLRAFLILCLSGFSSCEKLNNNLSQWNYRFDLSGVFQTLNDATAVQAIVFGGDTTVVFQQVTRDDPVIETEAYRLPAGFGGARGGMVGIRIDSLSELISYAATVSYDQHGWSLDARTYYYKYGEAFDIYDLWGMYTDKPPEYRPKIFDPLLWEKLDKIGDAPPGTFILACALNKYLMDQLQ